jgi:hypothetical protein
MRVKRRNFLKRLITIPVIGVLPKFAISNTEYKRVESDRKYLNRIDHQISNQKREKLKILIPLYSYPTDRDENGDLIWDRLIDIKNEYSNIEIVVIVNPTNGIFDIEDSNYSNGILKLTDANIKVIGYLYTDYANRDIDDIHNNIDKWKNIYQEYGVDGIFFDEVSSSIDNIKFYIDIIEYARSRGFEFNTLNPGTTIDQMYIDSNLADIVVTLEESEDVVLESPPSTYNSPSQNTKLALLVHTMYTNSVDELIEFARERQFTYIYFTDDGDDGNPWDSLSIYLEEEISKIMV